MAAPSQLSLTPRSDTTNKGDDGVEIVVGRCGWVCACVCVCVQTVSNMHQISASGYSV